MPPPLPGPVPSRGSDWMPLRRARSKDWFTLALACRRVPAASQPGAEWCERAECHSSRGSGPVDGCQARGPLEGRQPFSKTAPPHWCISGDGKRPLSLARRAGIASGAHQGSHCEQLVWLVVCGTGETAVPQAVPQIPSRQSAVPLWHAERLVPSHVLDVRVWKAIHLRLLNLLCPVPRATLR